MSVCFVVSDSYRTHISFTPYRNALQSAVHLCVPYSNTSTNNNNNIKCNTWYTIISISLCIATMEFVEFHFQKPFFSPSLFLSLKSISIQTLRNDFYLLCRCVWYLCRWEWFHRYSGHIFFVKKTLQFFCYIEFLCGIGFLVIFSICLLPFLNSFPDHSVLCSRINCFF